MNNILYRDKSFDKGLDRKIILLMLKATICWALPIIIVMVLPILIFNDIKIIGSIANRIYSIYIVIGIIACSIYIYYWSKNNMQMMSNFNLYFIKDEKDNLYFSYLNRDSLASYFKHNIKIDKKIKVSPFLMIYSFIFTFRTYGAKKVSFLKSIMYFKVNQKYQYAEQLLNSENFKSYCMSIYSIEHIKEFYKGIEFDANVVGTTNSKRHFVIYNTTENYQELCNVIYSYAKDYEIERDSDIIGSYERKTINKILFRKMRVFFFFTIIMLAILIDRYMSYKADIGNTFILKQYMASRHMYFIRYILVVYLFVFIKDFLVSIIDIVNSKNFKYRKIKIDSIYEEKSILNKIFNNYKKYVYITYNNKSMKLGTTNDFNSDTGLLILKNNKPYCVIGEKE